MMHKKWLRMRRQNGQVVITLAFLLLPLLAVAGLAIDLGRLFVVKAEIAKAVDGAALAGARMLPQGQVLAQQAANNFAGMNFAPGFLGTTGHSFTVGFSQDPTEPKVSVSGEAVMPTTLIRLVGIDQVTVRAEAEATRRSLQLAMVLDTSGSMDEGNAIGALRNGARNFVDFFDDTMDQMALVQYASGRQIRFPLGYNFKSPMKSAINGFYANGATTCHDALATAGYETISDPRPEAYRAIVFFTDGKPTSFRDDFYVYGMGTVDAVIGGYQNPAWDDPPDPMFHPLYVHDEIPGAHPPNRLNNGWLATTENILFVSWWKTRNTANVVRDNDITIFTIGLGNPNAGSIMQPDPDLLVRLANVPSAPDPLNPGGTIVNPDYDPDQPQGAFYFAPSAAELEEVFDRVAREIAIRLTK